MANGNGKFNIGMMITIFIIILSGVVYTVTRTENAITRIENLEKRFDRFESKLDGFLNIFGFKPADK